MKSYERILKSYLNNEVFAYPPHKLNSTVAGAGELKLTKLGSLPVKVVSEIYRQGFHERGIYLTDRFRYRQCNQRDKQTFTYKLKL